MTTENVAILFTDIVGSTELSQRLSVEVADELRREHFSILRQAITESGGVEVKNLGPISPNTGSARRVMVTAMSPRISSRRPAAAAVILAKARSLYSGGPRRSINFSGLTAASPGRPA